VQVQRGPAQGLWLHLNPRTGHSYFEGEGELEVQRVMEQYLRPGMIFYDIGANIGFFSPRELSGKRAVSSRSSPIQNLQRGFSYTLGATISR
jgi:hypothetical protein